MKRYRGSVGYFIAPLLAVLFLLCAYGYAQPSSSPKRTIPAKHLIQPEQLARILRSPKAPKPLVLQVGSRVLYDEAHIAGSEYVGAGGEKAGLQALRDRVKDLKRDEPLVIYCGCCAWNKCPNIRPAYHELTSLGFTNVKALYLAHNFGTDWVAKGYPVAKGQ
jgi:hypothetical protein